MEQLDYDERLAFEGVADPFMDIDCTPETQTGSDWYALALSASLGGKALHGFTFATTSETIGKTTHQYASNHTCGWIRTNEASLGVEQPGEEWDELIRPTRLHTGVVTGSQLSLMFDTGTWEPASATRARNTAFLAAGLVTHGEPISRALDLTTKISGESVSEAAVMNTVVPVSHLKREAAGVAKSSHAIFSRMNAQRYISWTDTQLHEGILPQNASIDWAKITVIARYIAEANCRYDPKFREIARGIGVPYIIVKGSWAYVSASDYRLESDKWDKIQLPDSPLVQKGALNSAYSAHTERLTTQIMRTYNELASEGRDEAVDSLLQLAENLRSRRSTKRVTVTSATDVLAETYGHQQSAALAASTTAASATSYNALVQSVGEMVMTDRTLVQRASYIVAVQRRYEEVLPQLSPFFTIIASRHVWLRAFELLDALIGNPRTSLDRMNRLHRSITQSSQTIEVDVPLSARSKSAMGPHIVALLKKVLVRPGPTVALPRYITSVKSAVARGEHAQLLRAIGDHLDDYKSKWADRYEDWARVYALAGSNKRKSILMGACARAFRDLRPAEVTSSVSGFIDGANIRTSYLFKMATDYAKKRKLARPKVPITPIGSAKEYALMLDEQYDADVQFTEVEEFVRERLQMFSSDLALYVEPIIPDTDEPNDDELQPKVEEDDADLLAQLEEMMGGNEDIVWVTEDKVRATYPENIDPDDVAAVNGFENFSDAYLQLSDGARWDTESVYTNKYIRARDAILAELEEEVEDDGAVLA